MPLAKDVAAEFRRLADCLEQNPEAEVKDPLVSFYHYTESDKTRFLNIVRLLPHPLKKEFTNDDVRIGYKTDAVWIYAKIPRNAICELVEPAKPAVYKCEPLLSDAQIEEIGSEVA